MDSKFAIIDTYENVNIFRWDEEEMLDVVRSIMDVEVHAIDNESEIHPTDNFGLEEWAMYLTLANIAQCETRDGTSTSEIYERYHEMGITELEGMGW